MAKENKNEYKTDVAMKSCHSHGKILPLQMYCILIRLSNEGTKDIRCHQYV